MIPRRSWTRTEIEYLYSHRHLPVSVIAERLHRTTNGVKLRMSREGLLDSGEQIFFICPACEHHIHSKAVRWVGATPAPLEDRDFVQVRLPTGNKGFQLQRGLTMRQALDDPDYAEYTEDLLHLLQILGRNAGVVLETS